METAPTEPLYELPLALSGRSRCEAKQTGGMNHAMIRNDKKRMKKYFNRWLTTSCVIIYLNIIFDDICVHDTVVDHRSNPFGKLFLLRLAEAGSSLQVEMRS